jgi:hypothetical protein
MDHIAQSPSSSPTILPDFESGRSSLPLSMLAALIQASMACLIHVVFPLPVEQFC